MFFAVMIDGSVARAGFASLALLGAFWLGRTLAPVGSDLPPPPASEIAASEQPEAEGAALEAVSARSRELEAQVAWLQAQLAQLVQEDVSPSLSAGGATAAAPGRRQGVNGKRRSDASEGDASAFDATELLASGVTPREVRRLRELSEEIERKRSKITQSAQREGRLGDRRHRDEMAEVERAAREEVGDDGYDALLYATGRQNRAKIRVLLEDSPGRSFGLEAGDVVQSYDDRLIFSPYELRRAAGQGEPGEFVKVDVLRDGELVQLLGQRGPIGARLQPARVPPTAR
jgi:hypothetical protein